jgi:hypothetical protein
MYDMYLCVRGIDVGHVFVCEGVSMYVMYLCVRGIAVGHILVC